MILFFFVVYVRTNLLFSNTRYAVDFGRLQLMPGELRTNCVLARVDEDCLLLDSSIDHAQPPSLVLYKLGFRDANTPLSKLWRQSRDIFILRELPEWDDEERLEMENAWYRMLGSLLEQPDVGYVEGFRDGVVNSEILLIVLVELLIYQELNNGNPFEGYRKLNKLKLTEVFPDVYFELVRIGDADAWRFQIWIFLADIWWTQETKFDEILLLCQSVFRCVQKLKKDLWWVAELIIGHWCIYAGYTGIVARLRANRSELDFIYKARHSFIRRPAGELCGSEPSEIRHRALAMVAYLINPRTTSSDFDWFYSAPYEKTRVG